MFNDDVDLILRKPRDQLTAYDMKILRIELHRSLRAFDPSLVPKCDRLALKMGFLTPANDRNPTLHIPDHFDPFSPTLVGECLLKEIITTVSRAAKRTVTWEPRIEWQGIMSDVDCVIGPMDGVAPPVVVVEAYEDWSETGYPPALAGLGCLLRQRVAAELRTPVFAVIANPRDFRFFAIDVQSVVYCSSVIPCEWENEASRRTILRWLLWMATFPCTWDDEVDEDGVEYMREFFGPRK